MTESTPASSCRSCGGADLDPIIDLGPQPDPDRLLDRWGSDTAPEAPIRLSICSTCGLVQLVGPRPDGPGSPHGHGGPAIGAADAWLQRLLRELPPDHRIVSEVDGSASSLATAIADFRVPTRRLSSGAGTLAGLVLVGHALAHADDLDRLLSAVESELAPRGLVAVDFHHLLGLVNGQFDVLSHAHRSYLSLLSLEAALERHDLVVCAAETTAEYGGSVRVLAKRRRDGIVSSADAAAIEQVRQAELDARIARRDGFDGLSGQVMRACADLRDFLDDALRDGRTVAGYGAAARGTTLLNLAGVGVDRLSFTVDRSPAKQHRLLPRSRIPVLPPDEIERIQPDDVLLLPWPLATEIAEQLASARGWGARFVVAMPRLEVLP
jgi:hypothetical protein